MEIGKVFSDSKCHEEGFGAYYDGVDSSACPYQAWTPEFKSWIEGYEDAAWIDEDDDMEELNRYLDGLDDLEDEEEW